VKVSIATTNALAPGGQFVLGTRSLPGNPYDGHTLAAQIAQTERLTGVAIERAYVDRSYRGHDADWAHVILSGQKRGIRPTTPASDVGATPSSPSWHMKKDGHLGRNFLLGAAAFATNLILAAAGHNLRPSGPGWRGSWPSCSACSWHRTRPTRPSRHEPRSLENLEVHGRLA
jgi:transposase, IS5 family